MINPTDAGADAAGGNAPPGSRNARYAYLVGRLRNRQITMEEATELFTLMQASLSRSEAARMAALAQASAISTSSSPTPPPPPPPSAPMSGSSDDVLILGLLMMGAGAGLLSAMSRKIQEPAAAGTPPAKAPPPK
jgi:hypothetical protein